MVSVRQFCCNQSMGRRHISTIATDTSGCCNGLVVDTLAELLVSARKVKKWGLLHRSPVAQEV